MATFTIALKNVLELTDDIGLEEYPLFDNNYRPSLNKKIIDHYWNQEIGQESVDMFRLAVRRRMNEIMPYYNQLYESEKLKIKPLTTFETESETETTGESTATSDSESEASNMSSSEGQSRTVSSETPQTRLGGDEDYATAAQDAASTSGATGSATDATKATQEGTQASQNVSRASGFQGSQAELLTRYRQTFLNIDMMIIEDLANCFMLIWGTGDEYAYRGRGIEWGYYGMA